MAYLFVVLLYCFKVFVAEANETLGLEEGDRCTLKSNLTGYCTNVYKCDYAYTLLVFNYRPQLCGFNGLDSIVCCRDLQSLYHSSDTPTRSKLNNENFHKNKTLTQLLNTSSTLVTTETSTIRIFGSKFNSSRSFSNDVTQSAQSITEIKCRQYYPKVNGILINANGTGGVPALPKEFKHMAGIGFASLYNPQWFCGGSLISENFVVTAAHCTFSSVYGEPVIVRLGDLNITTTTSRTIQDIPIKAVYPHPSYNQPAKYNDIGLIELQYAATLNRYVFPACLDITGEIGDEVLIATGWGRTSFVGEFSSRLLKIDLNVVPYEQCKKFYSSIKKFYQICAGDGKTSDTCQVDSGGPLQLQDFLVPDDVQKVYFIVGITSYGKACGISGSPGVYTRVYPYLDWIENIVWGTE